MSTLIRPHKPHGSEPSGDDDDVTGVRALLSALPEPDPMPEHLVNRINASLTAEQAQRAARMSAAPVTPLVARRHRRPMPGRRYLFAIAGAAAAVAVVSVAGSSMFSAPQPSTVNGSATIAGDSRAQEDSAAAPPRAAKKGASMPSASAGAAMTPSVEQIGQSGTRYTRADFATQARALRSSLPSPIQPQSGESDSSAARQLTGPAATTSGLIECLRAIGAAGAQLVRADAAFYEGRPAVIIVATTNGLPVAYAVGPQCSRADAALLHPATGLP